MTNNERPRILVVEDAALVAMLLEEMLDELGFDVIGPATDNEGACRMAREPGITAAILDVNLHGKMSWDVAALLKQANVPFAFSTGYDSTSMTSGSGRRSGHCQAIRIRTVGTPDPRIGGVGGAAQASPSAWMMTPPSVPGRFPLQTP